MDIPKAEAIKATFISLANLEEEAKALLDLAKADKIVAVSRAKRARMMKEKGTPQKRPNLSSR